MILLDAVRQVAQEFNVSEDFVWRALQNNG